MPSTVGHALAGIAAAWSADLVPGGRAWRTGPPDTSWYRRIGDGLTVTCAVLAAIPDADLLVGGHRTYSHSIGGVIFVGVGTALIAAGMRRPIARVAGMCAAAYATHLLLDWLGMDTSPPYGIQAFWPFSDAWFISGLNVFRMTERENFLSLYAVRINALAVLQEVAVLAPVLAALWLVREKTLARLAPEVAGGDHAAE